MKQQIKRLSPHQNGKVFGILMAVGSLPFLLLMGLGMMAAPNGPHMGGGPQGFPSLFMLVVVPLGYLVFGYLSVALGCVVYNFLYPTIGGFEFEATDQQE